MCVTEIWTYQDCGCQYQLYCPCPILPSTDSNLHELEAGPNSASHRPENQQPSEWPKTRSPSASKDSSPSKRSRCSLQYGDWLSKKEGQHDQSAGSILEQRMPSSRPCSMHVTVGKQFLEPICDNCVVAEARGSIHISSYSTCLPSRVDSINAVPGTPEHYRSGQERSSDDQIYSSYSDVDVDANRLSNVILESNVEIQIMDAMQDDLTEQQAPQTTIKNFSLPTPVKPTKMDHGLISDGLGHEHLPLWDAPTNRYRPTSTLTTNTTGHDADDEGSLHALSPTIPSKSTVIYPSREKVPVRKSSTAFLKRGLRNASKELRRVGMDVSREDLRLRVSSRLASNERPLWNSWRERLTKPGGQKTRRDQDDSSRWGSNYDLPNASEQDVRADSGTDLGRGRGRSSVRKWASEAAIRVNQSLRRSGSRGRRGRGNDAELERNMPKGRGSPLRNNVSDSMPDLSYDPTESSSAEAIRQRRESQNAGSNSQSTIATIFEYLDVEHDPVDESPPQARLSWDAHLQGDLSQQRMSRMLEQPAYLDYRNHASPSTEEKAVAPNYDDRSYEPSNRLFSACPSSARYPSIPMTSSSIVSSASAPAGFRHLDAEMQAQGEEESVEYEDDGDWTTSNINGELAQYGEHAGYQGQGISMHPLKTQLERGMTSSGSGSSHRLTPERSSSLWRPFQ